MDAPPLPDGWERPVRRTSVRATKMPFGVPMELLASYAQLMK